jgi:hypothetical protein
MGASRPLPPDNTFDWREAARVDHPPSAFDKTSKIAWKSGGPGEHMR